MCSPFANYIFRSSFHLNLLPLNSSMKKIRLCQPSTWFWVLRIPNSIRSSMDQHFGRNKGRSCMTYIISFNFPSNYTMLIIVLLTTALRSFIENNGFQFVKCTWYSGRWKKSKSDIMFQTKFYIFSIYFTMGMGLNFVPDEAKIRQLNNILFIYLWFF